MPLGRLRVSARHARYLSVCVCVCVCTAVSPDGWYHINFEQSECMKGQTGRLITRESCVSLSSARNGFIGRMFWVARFCHWRKSFGFVCVQIALCFSSALSLFLSAFINNNACLFRSLDNYPKQNIPRFPRKDTVRALAEPLRKVADWSWFVNTSLLNSIY